VGTHWRVPGLSSASDGRREAELLAAREEVLGIVAHDLQSAGRRRIGPPDDRRVEAARTRKAHRVGHAPFDR
jgi:hypothetical protein